MDKIKDIQKHFGLEEEEPEKHPAPEPKENDNSRRGGNDSEHSDDK